MTFGSVFGRTFSPTFQPSSQGGGITKPTDIAGCKLWFDFSDANSLFTDAGLTKVANDGDLIYQVNDKSGNEYNARQITSNVRPLYKTGIKNGLSVAHGLGSNCLELVDGNGLARNVAGLTLFAVYKTLSVAAGRKFIFTITTKDSASRASLSLNYIAGKSEVGGRRLDTDTFQSINGGNINSTSFFALCGAFDYANSNLYLYDNSVLTNSNLNFQTDGNTSDTDSAFIQIGNRNSSLYGYWAEILAYNVLLSDTDRRAVETYLNNKWAIY